MHPGRLLRTVLPSIVVLALLALLADPVVATTVGPYSSTSDFDLGTKSDSAGDHFLDNGADSPLYGFTNVPPAHYQGGRTYVAYQGGINDAPYVTYYDHAANTWATPVMAYTLNTLNQDGHGGPAILVQSTGRIHVFFSAHDSDMKYSRSRSVSDISSWQIMTDISGTTTYPHVWETSNNTIYLLYRCGGLDAGDWCWRFSTDTGTTWSAATAKIDLGAAATAYVGHGQLVSGKYVFAYVKHNDDGDNKRKNVYACRIDMATGNLESFSGTNLGLLLDDTESTASCRIEDTGTDETWYAALDADGSGNPYVIYSRGTGTNIRVRWSYWTGSAWTSPSNILTTDDLSAYSALIATSATDVEAFIATSSSPSAYNGDLQRWTWNGAWTLAETLKTEAASGVPVNFPFVPIDYDAEIKVVFAEWGVNLDTNALVPHAKIYGWGSGGFASSPAPTRYLETVTDNPNVASGAVQLEGATADLFAIADSDGDTFKWDPIASAGCTNGVIAATVSRSIAGGVLSVSDVSGTNACRAGVRLAVSVTGDWDFRIRLDRGASGVGRIWEMHVINDPRVVYCADSGTADGILYQAPAESSIINAFTCVNGAFAQVGTNTAEPGDPQYYRLTRSTNTFTWYYSADGSSWTQDEQTTNAGIANPVYFLLTLFAGTPSGTTTTGDYDNFLLASGTLAQGGYRRSGTWTSPTTVLADRTITTITLGHSALSSTAYIDRVDVLVNSVIVWSSTDDVTSGTQTVLSPNQDVTGDVAVRVTLASNGASTPVLEDVAFSHEEVLAGGNPFVPRIFPAFGYTVHGSEVTFHDRTTYEGVNRLVYAWSFGDGTTATDTRAPTHTYDAGGAINSYWVTLTVCDGVRCRATGQQVTVVRWDIVFLVGAASSAVLLSFLAYRRWIGSADA